MSDTLNTRVYWISTGLLGLGMLGAGVQEVLRAPDLVEAGAALGYPEYLLTILGVAKLLGAPVLLAPQFRILKEWAYAGFTFDFSGAFISHLVVGDPVDRTAPAAVCLGILSISYFFYRRWRTANDARSQAV